MDHGIEDKTVRMHANKYAFGLIKITAIENGTHLIITIEDDERGLD
ncbi:MAG: hypothetical protein IT292_02305 [Deltaproteobacteria bacterium]|nr:hypothetical protein [Deltaproteobacteria bacterium]